MNHRQFQREQRLAVRRAELGLLAQGRSTADPRYVQDVVDFIWSKLVDRKLQNKSSLPPHDQQRLNTLTGLCA
jgi:hypothetical protein